MFKTSTSGGIHPSIHQARQPYRVGWELHRKKKYILGKQQQIRRQQQSEDKKKDERGTYKKGKKQTLFVKNDEPYVFIFKYNFRYTSEWWSTCARMYVCVCENSQQQHCYAYTPPWRGRRGQRTTAKKSIIYKCCLARLTKWILKATHYGNRQTHAYA